MQNIKTYLVILAFAPVNFLIAQGSSYWQQKVDYQMEVKLDVEQNSIGGTQKLKYWNNSPNTLEKVYYHLYYNAFQPGSEMDVRSRTIVDPDSRVGDRISKLKDDEIGFQKILSLKQDGKRVEYSINGTTMEVQLNKALKPNSSSTFEMEFEAQIPLQIRRTGRDNREGIRYSMTQWYPKLAEFDELGWHTDPYVGREFHGVWGDYDVKITIDSSYVIGGTGYLQNAKEIGHGYLEEGEKPKRKSNSSLLTWHFKAPKVHDFAFGADPDYVHTTTKLNDETTLHFFFQRDSNTVFWDSLPHYTKLIFQKMNEKFGKYPYKQYSVIQGGDGGMEYPMATLITGHRSKGSLIGVTAHEAIHSWYQLLLATNESLYPWMDEGFTSYAGDVVLSEILPTFTPFVGSYSSYFRLVKSGMQEPLSTHADHYNTNRAYGVAAYSMGSMFLRQLNYIVGEEVMMDGMKKYYYQWRYKHPKPSDFIKVMENESGISLQWYLREWIYSLNHIDYGIRSVDQKDGSTAVLIENFGTMPMPLDIKITYTDSTSKTINIPLAIMHGNKSAEKGVENYEVVEAWPWTYPIYELIVDAEKSTILSIEIDPSMRMADIDRGNNFFPPKHEPIIFRSTTKKP